MTWNLPHIFQDFFVRDVPGSELIFYHIFSRLNVGIIFRAQGKMEDKRDKERNENGY